MAIRPPIETYDELDSTNAEARRRAEAGERRVRSGSAPGCRWPAVAGGAGRGQTQTGNLAATLLTLTDRPPAEAAQLSFVAALAACDLADTCLGVGAARLKWPNDVLVHGRKAVGILVESGARPDGRLWLAVGIGVNLKPTRRPTPSDRPRPSPSTWPDRRPEPRGGAGGAGRCVRASGGARGLSRASRRSPPAGRRGPAGLGQPCEARLPNRTLSGVAEGLDNDGALRLRLDDGALERITAGDVFFGEA